MPRQMVPHLPLKKDLNAARRLNYAGVWLRFLKMAQNYVTVLAFPKFHSVTISALNFQSKILGSIFFSG
jgi:hypothetical protein